MVFTQRAEDNPVGTGVHAEPLTPPDPTLESAEKSAGPSEPGMPGVVEGVLVDLSTPPPQTADPSSQTTTDLLLVDLGSQEEGLSSKQPLDLISVASEEEKESKTSEEVDEVKDDVDEVDDGPGPGPAPDTSELALGGGLGLVGGVLVDLREPEPAAPGPIPGEFEPRSGETDVQVSISAVGSDTSG